MDSEDNLGDNLAQLRTCTDLVEEDEAFVTPQVNNVSGDERDIDDGEFWGDAEESDIDYDIDNLDCDKCGTDKDESSHNIPDSTQHEEIEFCRAHNIVSFLSVAVAMWSYRYNITHGALNTLLKLLYLFVSLLSSISSCLSSMLSIFP